MRYFPAFRGYDFNISKLALLSTEVRFASWLTPCELGTPRPLAEESMLETGVTGISATCECFGLC